MNEIKVLWLDDESAEFLSNEDWRAQFEDEGITLCPEKYAVDAIERIKENPKQWAPSAGAVNSAISNQPLLSVMVT